MEKIISDASKNRDLGNRIDLKKSIWMLLNNEIHLHRNLRQFTIPEILQRTNPQRSF